MGLGPYVRREPGDRNSGQQPVRAGIAIALLSLVACQGCRSTQPSPPPRGDQTMAAHSKSPSPAAVKTDEHEARVLAQALKKKPDHVPVLLRLASLASGAGKAGEAEHYLSQALEIEPGNAEARLELGKLQFERGRVREAIRTTEEILVRQPNNPDALYNLGAIYGNLGNKQRALEYWNQLISSSPDTESGRRARRMMAELVRTAP